MRLDRPPSSRLHLAPPYMDLHSIETGFSRSLGLEIVCAEIAHAFFQTLLRLHRIEYLSVLSYPLAN